MKRINTKEFKQRLVEISNQHFEEWLADNPIPPKPAVDILLKEMQAGNFDIRRETLDDWIGWLNDSSPDLFDVIETPSYSAWRIALANRNLEVERLKQTLMRCRKEALDQALFGDGTALEALQRFKEFLP